MIVFHAFGRDASCFLDCSLCPDKDMSIKVKLLIISK